MSAPQIESLAVGAAPFIAAACRELRIDQTINAMVDWDEGQVKVSPGVAITALIINILTDRRPLYRVQEFYERQDTALLFPGGITAADLNDDTLGRSLDRLHAADPKHVFQGVACGAVCRGHVELKVMHADTTSVSVYGEYEPSEKDIESARGGDPDALLDITNGYSKQRRPDLKQFLYGVMVNADGVPVLGTVDDGNLNDKTWNQQVIEEFKSSFIDPRQIIYVADSALVTEETLAAMHQAKMRFISRLPETYNLAAELKDKAWRSGRWLEIGQLREGKNAASYATQSFDAKLYGRTYRFIVVRSSALDQRKLRMIERRIARERAEMEKEAKALAKQVFFCRPDAEKALESFCNQYTALLPTIAGSVEERITVKRPKGRPRKGVECPSEIRYCVSVAIGDPDPVTLAALHERESAFVLITSLEEDVWSDAEVLHEYKEQSRVELNFRFLKHPLLIGGIYVQSVRRAEALAYVFLLALLVASYIQMKVRKALRERRQTVELEGRRVTKLPTVRAILDLLNSIQVVIVETHEGVTRILPRNVDRRALQMIELAGYDASIYTTKV